MNNLHISLTEFRNESRVLRETESLCKLNKIDHIYIAALHADDLEIEECISSQISLKRFALRTRGLNKGLFGQASKYLEFFFRVLFFYRKNEIGIVNVHALSLLPMGCLLKIIYSAKLIYDAHELETETNDLHGFRKRLSKLVEISFIKKVDHVFVVSESIADWYQESYDISRPTVLLNAPKRKAIVKTDYFRKKFKLRDEQQIVLYQGNLSSGRGVNLLLKLFKKRKDDKLIIIFMGYGEFEEKIKETSKKYKNIFFHKAVNPKVLQSRTTSADIGVSFIENTCLSYYLCLPNKLFEYAMAGLPVIVSNMKEMQEFVEKYRIGVVVDTPNTREISKAIERLLSLDIRDLSRNGRKAAIENAWEVQEVKMLAVYERLLEAA